MKEETKSKSFASIYNSDEKVLFPEGRIVLDRYTILQADETYYVRFSFRQYSEKRLTALSFDVFCFDIWGNETERVDHVEFLDLCANDKTVFGQTIPIRLSNNSTRVLQLILKNVAYEDSSALCLNEPGKALENKKELGALFTDPEILLQYKKETSDSARFLPFEQDNIKVCTCGFLYRATLASCPACGVNFETATTLLSEQTLQEHIVSQKREEEKRLEERRLFEESGKKRAEEAQKAMEAAQQQKREEEERLRAEELAKKQKKFKHTLLICSSVAVVIALVLASVFYFIPLISYNVASNALLRQDYDAAISGFSAISSFKDAKNQANEAKYQKASLLIESLDYSNAKILFESMGDFRDCKNQAELCDTEIQFQEAVSFFEQENYEEAAKRFDTLAEKKQEAAEYALQAHYLFAETCIAKKDYQKAVENYTKAETYKDAPDKLTEAKYLFALDCIEKKDYENAYACFSEIPQYKDVTEKIKEAAYQYGLQLVEKKEWNDAITLLETVAPYSDSAERLKEAKYGYINSHKDANDPLTHIYLEDLKKENYKDTSAIYSQLYPELAPGKDPEVRVGAVFTTGLYRISEIAGVNIRRSPGADTDKIGAYNYRQTVTVVEVSDNWGRTDKGWICLDYTEKISNQTVPDNVNPYGYMAGIYTISDREGLNIRISPEQNSKKVGVYLYKTVVYVYEVSGNWGHTDKGWICLDYTTMM